MQTTCELVFWGEQGQDLVAEVPSIDGHKAHIRQTHPDLRGREIEAQLKKGGEGRRRPRGTHIPRNSFSYIQCE